MRIRNTFIGQSLEVTGQAPLSRTTIASRPSRSGQPPRAIMSPRPKSSVSPN